VAPFILFTICCLFVLWFLFCCFLHFLIILVVLFVVTLLCYFSFVPLLALLSAPCGFRWSQNLITFKNFKLFQNSIYGIFHLVCFFVVRAREWDRHTFLFQKITYYNNNNRNASGSNPAVRQVAHPQKCTNISSIAFVSLLQIDLILYKPTSFVYVPVCWQMPHRPPIATRERHYIQTPFSHLIRVCTTI